MWLIANQEERKSIKFFKYKTSQKKEQKNARLNEVVVVVDMQFMLRPYNMQTVDIKLVGLKKGCTDTTTPGIDES